MIILETIAVAFSMFSAIPMPKINWNVQNMRYSLCAFPLIGAVIALCVWGWFGLCRLLSFPGLLQGAGCCLLPVLITGGIHLDGYADTCDALASHADMEEKQKILKDPHIGTFAVIRLCTYFTVELALGSALSEPRFPVLLGLFCLSRTMSALSLTSFPLREGNGLARSFADAADRKWVKRFLMTLAGLLSFGLILQRAWEFLPVSAMLFLYFRRVCEKDFGGLSGDLAGWFLQKVELWMLAALVLRQYFGGTV